VAVVKSHQLSSCKFLYMEKRLCVKSVNAVSFDTVYVNESVTYLVCWQQSEVGRRICDNIAFGVGVLCNGARCVTKPIQTNAQDTIVFQHVHKQLSILSSFL
jgi:hypothetical protein